jgi:hypothetical protein
MGLAGPRGAVYPLRNGTSLAKRLISLAPGGAVSRSACKLITSRAPSVLTAVLAVSLLATSTARAYTPESPAVKAMVQDALGYLSGAPSTSQSSKLGGQCLVALAFVNAGFDEKHPKVARALNTCKRFEGRAPNAITEDVYSTGIAVSFLCALEKSKHRKELEYGGPITSLLRSLELRQKPHGGWGYRLKVTGDTSMTQYGVLASWYAKQVGIEVSTDSLERVTNWLIRVQDASGGFPYQGEDPGGFVRIKQKVRYSLAPAGLGSLYILADTLGHSVRRPKATIDLPALRLKQLTQDGNQVVGELVNPERLRSAQKLGNRYLAANFKIDPIGYTHYYMYALERCQSFRELADGKTPAGSRWYDEGVRYLARTQSGRGSWLSKHEVVDTAFAVLFLTRSTKRAIKPPKKRPGGTLTIGKGLPSNLDKIVVRRDGKIVRPKFAGPAEDQLAILEKGKDHPEYQDYVDYHGDLLAGISRKELRQWSQRLRRLLKSGARDARGVAAEALGQIRDLDNAPALIEALSDPSWKVKVKARDSLLTLSRRLEAFGLSDTKPDIERDADLMRVRSIRRWKAWYKSIRPDAKFDS